MVRARRVTNAAEPAGLSPLRLVAGSCPESSGVPHLRSRDLSRCERRCELETVSAGCSRRTSMTIIPKLIRLLLDVLRPRARPRASASAAHVGERHGAAAAARGGLVAAAAALGVGGVAGPWTTRSSRAPRSSSWKKRYWWVKASSGARRGGRAGGRGRRGRSWTGSCRRRRRHHRPAAQRMEADEDERGHRDEEQQQEGVGEHVGHRRVVGDLGEHRRAALGPYRKAHRDQQRAIRWRRAWARSSSTSRCSRHSVIGSPPHADECATNGTFRHCHCNSPPTSPQAPGTPTRCASARQRASSCVAVATASIAAHSACTAGRSRSAPAGRRRPRAGAASTAASAARRRGRWRRGRGRRRCPGCATASGSTVASTGAAPSGGAGEARRPRGERERGDRADAEQLAQRQPPHALRQVELRDRRLRVQRVRARLRHDEQRELRRAARPRALAGERERDALRLRAGTTRPSAPAAPTPPTFCSSEQLPGAAISSVLAPSSPSCSGGATWRTHASTGTQTRASRAPGARRARPVRPPSVAHARDRLGKHELEVAAPRALGRKPLVRQQDDRQQYRQQPDEPAEALAGHGEEEHAGRV